MVLMVLLSIPYLQNFVCVAASECHIILTDEMFSRRKSHNSSFEIYAGLENGKEIPYDTALEYMQTNEQFVRSLVNTIKDFGVDFFWEVTPVTKSEKHSTHFEFILKKTKAFGQKTPDPTDNVCI